MGEGKHTSDSDRLIQLPSVDDQLLQAINILKLCGKQSEINFDTQEFDQAYPLWAAVSLLEDFDVHVADAPKIIQAQSIVKAVAVTLTTTDQDIGEGGFEPSWCLNVAIDLIDDVIHERAKKHGKKRARPKKAMREISTVDPEHARQFHRLLTAAGKLPVAELERLARYAEIELVNGKKPRVAIVDTKLQASALAAPSS